MKRTFWRLILAVGLIAATVIATHKPAATPGTHDADGYRKALLGRTMFRFRPLPHTAPELASSHDIRGFRR